MSILAELKRYEAEVKRINAKVAQALRMRLRIMNQIVVGVRKWELGSEGWDRVEGEDKKSRARAILQRAVYDERRLLKVLDNGLGEGIIIMERIRALMKNAKAERVMLKKIDYLLWTLKYTDKQMKKIESRVAKQERFLASKDQVHFKAFVKMWRKEAAYDKAIATKLNPAKINKVGDFMKKWAIGGGIGVFNFIAGSTGAAIITTAAGGSPQVKAIAILITGIVAGLGALSGAIYFHERDVFRIQQGTLPRLKQAV